MNHQSRRLEEAFQLATFFASTQLLHRSWDICLRASTNTTPFTTTVIDGVVYFAFPAIPTDSLDPNDLSLVAINTNGLDLFRFVEEYDSKPALVKQYFLKQFMNLYHDHGFLAHIKHALSTASTSKAIIFTGHSLGGGTASLAALWLLNCLCSTREAKKSILCITFGAPLIGDMTLARAVRLQGCTGRFCNVVSEYDPVPRLFMMPLHGDNSLPSILSRLLSFWKSAMVDHQQWLALNCEEIHHSWTSLLSQIEQTSHQSSTYAPLGNYLFCSIEHGIICLDDPVTIMGMFLTFQYCNNNHNGTPLILQHLNYSTYLETITHNLYCNNNTTNNSFRPTFPQLESPSLWPTKRTINAAELVRQLCKIQCARVEIEFYKTSCEEGADAIGYYDSFKTRKNYIAYCRANVNRSRLAAYWDRVIEMIESGELENAGKWIMRGQSYRLFVEPLDIADYYRCRGSEGHYRSIGRPKRFKILERWLWEKQSREGRNMVERKRYAFYTQDSCFWARIEEAKEWLKLYKEGGKDEVREELMKKMREFKEYAEELIGQKCVSKDVLLEKSSFSLWVNEFDLISMPGKMALI